MLTTPDDARRDAMAAGLLLGWLSVGAVLAAVVLGAPVRHVEATVALALAAAAGNAAMPLLNRREVRLLLDLWAGALLAFVGALTFVAGGEARFDLLLFLVLPFIAVTHEGPRLAGWLAGAAVVFAVAVTLAPDALDAAEVALHAVLLIASVILAAALSRTTRRTAAAAARAAAQAELEQALLAEAHHRIKNSLQTVADLLLLGRPDDPAGAEAFDATAARIRSIAAVHHLLAGERGGTVTADELLRTVVAAVAAPGDEVTVAGAPLRLESARAQQLGMIAGELVANALQHGAAPVSVALEVDDAVQLEVRDAGSAARTAGGDAGLGLTLVRQIAERGLGGSFSLGPAADGSTLARLRFNA
jgi:two-component sensor histidine kinase